MTFETLDIQKRIRRWVESRLGMAAMDLHERGMRSGEEQIELGQCCGVTREEYHALVDHVFDKPVGDIRQELGGTALTLLACADGAGYVLSECAIRELERVESLPPEKFRKRQDENVANGIGLPREENQMKAGDVVEFMGVPMTIGKIDGNKAWCQWFVEGALQDEWFYLVSLKAR